MDGVSGVSSCAMANAIPVYRAEKSRNAFE